MIIVSLMACQKSPEQELVQGKNDGQLESAIYQGQESRSDSEIIDSGKEITWEEFSYQDEFSGAEDTVTVKVDASGVWQTNHLPVLRVRPRNLTVEDVRLWGEVLTDANDYYEPKVQLTKREIEEILLEGKRIYEDEDTLFDYYEGDSGQAEWAKGEYERWKQIYEAQYADAPERDQQRESDWTFHPSDYYDLDSAMFSGDTEDGIPDLDEMLVVDGTVGSRFGRITARNYKNGSFYGNSLRYFQYSYLDDIKKPVYDPAGEKTISITQEQMLEQVGDALEKLGLGHMKLYKIYRYGQAKNGDDDRRERLQEGTEEDIYAYSLVYIPVYEGGEVTKQIQMSSYPDDSYGAMYDYEKVGVTVRENGITEFKWTAPLEVTSVENGDVQVLPFSEICQRFQSQMQIEYTLGRLSRENPQNSDYQEVLAGIKAGEIRVTDIQFGLVRIQIPNNYDEFRLVPAWSFRGIESLDTGGGHYWYEDLDQDALSRTEHV